MKLEQIVSDVSSALGAANKLLEERDKQPLSFGNLHTLIIVSQGGDLGMVHIAKRRGITSAAATGAVDELERRELAVRGTNPDDRRIIKVKLTELGTEVLKVASAAI